MDKEFKLSIEKARQMAISAQLLNSEPRQKDPVGLIEHLGYVQIDTISVVERAHHHTLWSRFPKFNNKTLDKLLQEKKVFEYWSHAASYLPMKDFRFSLYRKKQFSDGKSHWFEQDVKLKKHVLQRIKKEGSLQSKDFEHNKKSNGWYEWKPAKKALEQLFMEGKLMVAERKGFQKIYDLTERVLPSDIDTSVPTDQEYAEFLIKQFLQAHAFGSESEFAYLRRGIKPLINKTIERLLKSKQIIKIQIQDLKETYYTLPHSLELDENKSKSKLHILSPFDNLLIQRKRVQQIFDFDYLIECYVPEPKRKFGYFCLPLLYGNKFAGRIDAKADRKTKLLTVKNIWFEKSFKPSSEFQKDFKSKLQQFAEFNGCNEYDLTNSKF